MDVKKGPNRRIKNPTNQRISGLDPTQSEPNSQGPKWPNNGGAHGLEKEEQKNLGPSQVKVKIFFDFLIKFN